MKFARLLFICVLKLNLGMALHLAGKKWEAIAELGQAVKLDPQLAPAWLFLGTTRLQLGEALVGIIDDEQVQPAIVVIIEPPGRPPTCRS